MGRSPCSQLRRSSTQGRVRSTLRAGEEQHTGAREAKKWMCSTKGVRRSGRGGAFAVWRARHAPAPGCSRTAIALSPETTPPPCVGKSQGDAPAKRVMEVVMSPSTTLLRASGNMVRSAHAWLSEGWVRVDAQRSCCALAAAQGNVVCAREMCAPGGRATFNHRQHLGDGLLGRFDGRIRPRRRRARRRRARRARAMEKGWCPTATNSGNRAQVAPMAAFLLAVFGQLVTASGWEW